MARRLLESMRMRHLCAALVTVMACGSTKSGNPDAGDGTTLQVATTGDDANNGITKPLRTLRRAIELADTDPTITAIQIAAGRYDAAHAETFPYLVPPNLTIFGPAGGGAILAGTGIEPGLVVANGTLRDLEMESLMVAIDATATAT